MEKEEIIKGLESVKKECGMHLDESFSWICELIDKTIELVNKNPCCNCIEFKRYAKQMGFIVEKQSIPYLMHKEMDIPILECQKAYDVAIDYLRSQGKLKG